YSAETADKFPVTASKTIAFEGNAVLKQDVQEGWTTYNFEVREHHNYVADGIRVHNDSILSTLQEDDTLLTVNSDLTNAAVLRDVDGDGTADFVTLDGYRDPESGVFSTQLERVRVSYWDAANGDLSALLAAVVANNFDALHNVFDPGNGNAWNDGAWGDDIEEAYFDDVVGITGTGGPVGEPTGTPPYDEVIVYVDGVAVTVPDISGATDPVSLLASLSGLIAVVDGLAPGAVTYNAGSGNAVESAFQGISGVAAIAFLLGVDLTAEIIPAVTVDGPFGPVEVTPAMTLGSLLDGQVNDQSQFNVVFGEGIDPADVSQTQDGDNLVFTIDNGDGTVNTLTLEGVYTDGNTDEIAAVVFADGTSLPLDQISETVTGDGTITGTDGDDLIDGSYTDIDGDMVSSGDDIIAAGLGNDTLIGSEGNDIFDGGDGTDTVSLNGAHDEFIFASDGTITVTDSNTTTGTNEGTDTLISIETVTFTDGYHAEIVSGSPITRITFFAGGSTQATSRVSFDGGNAHSWADQT
ncbi:MAG TPA: hypothetical protein EYP10_11845, partial [Armatimonadetes bacterium]|nr:hypothetical protein [Armatimonadota bacterium]